MLKNFIRVSLRYLAKNRVYTVINVMGLALGIACFILLTLFVRTELSYDEYHEGKEHVYQLYMADSGDVDMKYEYAMQAPEGGHLVETVPEIVASTRFGGVPDVLVRVGNEKYIIPKIHYSDAETFRLFDIDILTGNKESLKLEKGQIIISASEAIRLYGSVDAAVGQELEIMDLATLEVVAVFADLPEESHLSFKQMVCFEYAQDLLFFKSDFKMDIDVLGWGFVSAFPTYLQLTGDEVDMADLEQKIHEAVLPHLGYKHVKLIRLDDVYFSEFNKGYFKDAGDLSQIKLYGWVALILLLIAIVNYTNMATARYTKRQKEVGIRKTIGGHRFQIVRQFLTESFVLVFFSMVLAVCIAELAMPFFNNYTGKEIDISYASPLTYLSFIGLSLLIGVVAGLYPSFYLSRFNPLQGLNNRGNSKEGGRFRQVLVGFQFAVCLAMMAVTGIVFSQFSHMQGVDKGFNTEQLVRIPLKDKVFNKQFDAFKEELLTSPFVTQGAGAAVSFDGVATFYLDFENLEEQAAVSIMLVENEFMEMLGVEKIEGRLFSEMQPSEYKGTYIVNESLVEMAEWENGLGQKLNSGKVGGVVKDFIYGSAKEAIAPLMIMEGGNNDYSSLFVKIEGNTKEAIRFMKGKYEEFANEYPFEFEFVDDIFAEKYRTEEMLSQVLGIFSGLTIFIAGLGILGLSIFVAEQRVKEIGIRRVLGASLGQIVWLLNSNVTKLILIISLVTLPAVYYFIQDWLNDFAYAISLNPMYFITPLSLLIAIVWAILFYQSFRTATSNPVNALRTE